MADDLTVGVRDATGRPVKDAVVTVHPAAVNGDFSARATVR